MLNVPSRDRRADKRLLQLWCAAILMTADSARPGGGVYSPDLHRQTQRPPRDTPGNGGWCPGTRHKSKISDEFDEFVQASSRGRKDWARIHLPVAEVTVSVDVGTGKSEVIDRDN